MEEYIYVIKGMYSYNKENIIGVFNDYVLAIEIYNNCLYDNQYQGFSLSKYKINQLITHFNDENYIISECSKN